MGLGRSEAVLWGECRGSALYQVRVDLSSSTVTCSCPSRKHPCKHGLGLLYLAAASPDALPLVDPPAWVSAWLAKRATAREKRATRTATTTEATKEPASPDAAKPAGRADKRAAAVAQGLDALDLWLDDLLRQGLATVETQPATFWERQAARMVDAQAPGIAARLRHMAGLPNASPDWPRHLLDELGRLALLCEAYRRLDTLAPALREDVRQAIGWTLKEEDVLARGEVVADLWLVLGQYVREEERLRMQRTWLRGVRTGRSAFVLQFSFGTAPFKATPRPGVRQEAELVYWPSAYPQRALVRAASGQPTALRHGIPGTPSFEPFLAEVARATACQPWLDRFLLVLNGAVPLWGEGRRWSVCDTAGHALPLAPGDYWDLLALSGGHPVDLAAEWDGTALLPLGLVVDGAYHQIGPGQ
jgi:hypothetical protein